MRKTNRITLPVIFGPTGVGKTELLISLFKNIGEVISSDSVQVYRGLDIFSAKVSKEEREVLPHHLVDIRDIDESYSSGEFCFDAEKAIYDISSRGKIPILSGGTPYYLRQFLYGSALTPPSKKEIRDKVKKEVEEGGNKKAFEKLKRLDAESAKKIDMHDSYRLRRALEVIEDVGKPLSSFKTSFTLRDDFNIVLILLKRDGKEMKKRVKERVDKMFLSNIEGEIKSLIKNGASLDLPCINTIGYKEYFKFLLTGEYSRETLKEEIVKNTLSYIRKQNTFFSLFKEAAIFNPDDKSKIIDYLSRCGVF